MKNENKHPFIDKKKNEDGVAVMTELACDKD